MFADVDSGSRHYSILKEIVGREKMIRISLRRMGTTSPIIESQSRNMLSKVGSLW